MIGVEDFVVYTTPEVMAEKCDFIRGWSKERLFELADSAGKTVLDVGAGSGRLTFAALKNRHGFMRASPSGRCVSLCVTKSSVRALRTSECWTVLSQSFLSQTIHLTS
ncbi:hypothetical protein CEB3_c45140 [Peptococcaceae bacterium CEB3]|nr:hypothetical protein CEB3_c45140 [Peptococcaceae bacterium CEB3]